MRIAIYVKKPDLKGDSRLKRLEEQLLGGGCELYDIERSEDIREGTDLLLSVGGDGTFLSASKRVGDRGIPVLGVNLGRLGFLSENAPEDVAEALLEGKYEIEERSLLSVRSDGESLPGDMYP